MEIIRTVSITCLAVWWISVMVLSDMPTMSLKPQNISAHTGDEARYKCFVNGTKTYLINCQWYFRQNGETNLRQLVNGEKYNWSCKNCSKPCRYSLHITIRDVAKNDTGNYVCEANTSTGTVKNEAQLRVYDGHDSRQQSKEDTTDSSLSNQVVHIVSAVAAMTFIALIALIVVIILTRHRAKPDPGMSSTNGQQQPSPSKHIHSGNGHPEIYILQLENPNYVEVILKSNTHIDKSTSTEDIHGSQVVSRTDELNYVDLEFNSDTHDEDSTFLIHGSPSNTIYTEVISTR